MAIFSIQLDNTPEVREFMKATAQRLKNKDIVKNPFNGFVRKVTESESELKYLVQMTPIWPKGYLWGFLGLLITWIFKGFNLIWFTPSLVLLSLGFFWSKYFYYTMLKLGLRKVKYKGPISLTDEEESIRLSVNKVL